MATSQVQSALRPVGHITDLIRDLERWKKNREAHQLTTRTLETTISYLEEYRKVVRDCHWHCPARLLAGEKG